MNFCFIFFKEIFTNRQIDSEIRFQSGADIFENRVSLGESINFHVLDLEKKNPITYYNERIIGVPWCKTDSKSPLSLSFSGSSLRSPGD